MGFTEQQVTALTSPLLREHVKEREQGGRKVSYIEGWHAIAEANRIFGFDAWDRELVECHCVSEKPCEIGQQKRPGFRVAYIGRVRITVRAGDTIVVREGAGYGSGIDVDVGAAHESALKEMETDSMKRALMTFGNPFGLALYDKTQSEVAPAPRTTKSAPTSRPVAAVNRAAMPPSAEEPPEVAAARERVRSLIHKIGTIIRTAPNRHVLEVALDDARDALREIEEAGDKGREAARELRRRITLRMSEFDDAA